MTPWHIQFEAPHGAGKDTLADAIAKRTNRLHSLHVRGPISDWVFATLYGRNIDYQLRDVAQDWARMRRFLLVVLVPEDIEQLDAHFTAKHSDAPYSNANLLHLTLFGAECFRLYGCKVLYLQARSDLQALVDDVLRVVV